jgi:hypothetical protein
MSFLAILPIGTKSRKIEFAENFAGVSLRAVWSQGAEALLVVGAGWKFVCGVDVQV